MGLPYTSKRYIRKDNTNPETRQQVSNATYYTKINDDNHFQSGMFVVAFYDINGDITTPTSGTLKVSVSPIEGQWREIATLNATDCGESATYEYPILTGTMLQGKVEVSGVVGADSIEGFFWRV